MDEDTTRLEYGRYKLNFSHILNREKRDHGLLTRFFQVKYVPSGVARVIRKIRFYSEP